MASSGSLPLFTNGQRIIFEMWLACHTQREIAKAVGLSRPQITEKTAELSEIDKYQKPTKRLALHEDEDFEKLRQI